MPSRKSETTIKKLRVAEGKKLLQIPLDEDLHHKFKVYAVTQRKTMGELIEEHIRSLLAKRQAGKQ